MTEYTPEQIADLNAGRAVVTRASYRARKWANEQRGQHFHPNALTACTIPECQEPRTGTRAS